MWLVYICRIFITTTLLLLFQQALLQDCYGCLREEHMALLELKAYWNGNINNVNAPLYDALPYWNSKDKDSECCGWERVGCDNTTGRVTMLDLSSRRQFIKQDYYGRLYIEPAPPMYLNASLFLPFQQLHTLDLSSNQLYGIVKDEGFQRLSTLTNLATLDLSENYFNDSILPSLSTLSSLTSLTLSSNCIRTWNGEDLKMLNKLESLYLGGNRLNTRFLDSVGTLSRLKNLSLNENHMNGSLVSNNISLGLCRLKRLEVLYLEDNNLEGILPSCLGNLTSLRILDLSYNRFVGNIASSPLVNLVSLKILRLSNNQFESLTPFSSFANHSKLLLFDLDNSGTNEFQVETEYPTNWIPTFQLQEFYLSHCTININYKMMPGVIPKFLYHQMDLITLQISFTNMLGEFPSWLLKNNTRLESLYLAYNSLLGPFDLPPSSQYSKNLRSLDVSNNHINGHLPMNIGTSLPNLGTLDLSNNSFHGDIPSSIGNMSLLSHLDLSNNKLSGEIPDNLARGSRSLTTLKLSNNQLHGQISPSIFNMTSLDSLYLDGNHFTGMNIPPSLSLSLSLINSSNDLKVLDVRDNNIMGGLPNWLGNMRSLRELRMSKNHFQGLIPETLCNLQVLQVLDLSDNNMKGSVPPCFNPSFIRYLNLRRNGLTRFFMNNDNNVFMKNSSKLVVLDLGDNDISGGISSIINGSFLELRILILKGNHFQGLLPKQLCHLYQISMMDLSFNYFSGPIPSCLANLTFDMTKEEKDFGLRLINDSMPNLILGIISPKEEYVKFTTKKRNEIYQGKRLRFVLGIDLSSNQLTGTIPHEIGNLSKIHTLNLSHNHLTGTIPSTFSKLDSVESLDLSYNNLSGSIPLELVQLTSLAVFNVAHNNLSGKTPDMKAQFATFDESSYEGNPFLCGPPLNKSCNVTLTSEKKEKEEDSSMNLIIFFGSFTASFAMGFVGVIVVLYINPYWRRVWFHMVDEWICSIDYFLLVIYYKLKHLVHA